MQALRIVHTEASCGWGGQEIRILTEARAMIDRGHQVEIWAAPGSNIIQDAARRGIPHRGLPIARKGWRGVMAIRKALTETRPAVVNTHSSTDAWLVAIACLTLRNPPPVVRTRHISAAVPRNLATRWLYTRATRRIVTTGERLRETLIRENRYRESRVTSIPTGVDTSRFRPADRDAARRALGLDPSARYVGIVATLRSWKGHLHLLEAFGLLAGEDPWLRLVIVGDGPMHSVIAERIEQAGLTGKVVLAGRQQAVEQWLQALDVFCLPSYANEGVPQSLVQAMLTRLPVVTTPVGGIPEAVADGVSGLIVPARDSEALAHAMRRVLEDPGLAGRLGAAARESAARNFGLETMVLRMELVFRDVIANHQRRRKGLRAHWQRFRRSIDRRWREFRLPRGYVRLGTRYGGWWVDRHAVRGTPVLIDCGLGRDISFPEAFLSRFGGTVVGIDPNPQSLAYCRERCPRDMQIRDRAFWTRAGETLTFHLPRPLHQLPMGADGVSGSLDHSHDYVTGGESLSVTTTSLDEVLASVGQGECDVLKLDIEGAEYEVLAALCSEGRLSKVRQLLVEFHHRATSHSFEETQATVARVEAAGFRLMHVEGRNYIFRRSDLG
jgi:FkbM family methyltransferase